ncbi:MAG: EAL domain-containing protein [Sulfolobales archaeon]
MTTKCRKCELLPCIPEDPSQIFFLTAHPLLSQKLKDFLKTQKVDYQDLEEGILCQVQNPRAFLNNLKNELNLSEPELKDISLVILDPHEMLSFKHFRDLRPLVTWYELLDAAEYLEVLENNRLTVYFHPIVDKDFNVVGQECLVRGVRSDGSIIPPAFLFEKAEKTQTLFFLDRACREVSIKTAAIKGLRDELVFINFIPTSIYDPRFCLQTTIKWAYQLEFNPSNVIFEVVESQKVSDIRHLSNILEYYKANGFRVALDDVGTGYSSLEMLVNLRPNFIKIDREIVRDIHHDPLRQSIVKALVQICRENDILLLAEGIEKEEEFSYLKDMVDYFQGFYFAKPNPEPIRKLPRA